MKETGWNAAICDISQGGILLHLQRRFERGSALALEIPGDSEHEPAVVFVKVVHIKAREEGSWALGCKFVSELSDDEVQRLLVCKEYVLSKEKEEAAPKPEAAADDVSVPNAMGVRTLSDVCIEIELDQLPSVYCTVKNLDVTNSWPLTSGKTLRINGNAKDRSAWSFEIEVLQLSQEGQRWKIRSRLADPDASAAFVAAIGKLRSSR